MFQMKGRANPSPWGEMHLGGLKNWEESIVHGSKMSERREVGNEG